MIKITLLFITLISFLNSSQAFSKTIVSIAAASDMKFAFDDLKKEFEKENSDSEISLTFGSSGKFYEQIKNGAPFDLFFSADIDLPNKLHLSGIGSGVSSYAIGKIVVWSTKYKDVKIDELSDLKFKNIAIANPEHAPYGKKAQEALMKLNLYEKIKGRLVFGENISQAAQFIETGAADVGIVALSIAMAPKLKNQGSYTLVSEKLYSPLIQGFILLKKENLSAVKFCQFIETEKAKMILSRFGFTNPTLRK